MAFLLKCVRIEILENKAHQSLNLCELQTFISWARNGRIEFRSFFFENWNGTHIKFQRLVLILWFLTKIQGYWKSGDCFALSSMNRNFTWKIDLLLIWLLDNSLLQSCYASHEVSDGVKFSIFGLSELPDRFFKVSRVKVKFSDLNLLALLRA